MSMFLRQRVLQAEYFDTLDRPMSEIRDGYAMLAQVNRIFSFANPFQYYLPKLMDAASLRSLSFLDLGAGDGSLGEELRSWAAKRGWDWRFTNMDVNQQAMQLNPSATWVAGSAMALPFRDRAFDVVIASQMTHHLMTDADAVQHFREAWRVTRQTLLINDMHRNTALYSIVWVLLRVLGFSKEFRDDGLLSVKRSWRVNEWRKMVEAAGISSAKVWLYGGARLMLYAAKE